MRAIAMSSHGDASVLHPANVPTPSISADEVLVNVVAAGVNRADLMQREGNYPPPRGASEILGLEVSGTIAEVGADVTGWSVGDRVCALLTGGGYAEKVAVPAGQLLPVPQQMDLVDAAALPEVLCTVWSNVFMKAQLQRGELLLIHGGSGGIGTIAIQLAKVFGARAAVTAGTREGLQLCRKLGADILIDYHDQDFVKILVKEGGADVILDVVGAAYLERNVLALALDGRLVIIGMQGGSTGELNIATLMSRRGAVMATGLRTRGRENKAEIVADVRKRAWPLIESGVIRPIVAARIPLDEAGDAQRLLDEHGHVGKVLLTT